MIEIPAGHHRYCFIQPLLFELLHSLSSIYCNLRLFPFPLNTLITMGHYLMQFVLLDVVLLEAVSLDVHLAVMYESLQTIPRVVKLVLPPMINDADVV